MSVSLSGCELRTLVTRTRITISCNLTDLKVIPCIHQFSSWSLLFLWANKCVLKKIEKKKMVISGNFANKKMFSLKIKTSSSLLEYMYISYIFCVVSEQVIGRRWTWFVNTYLLGDLTKSMIKSNLLGNLISSLWKLLTYPQLSCYIFNAHSSIISNHFRHVSNNDDWLLVTFGVDGLMWCGCSVRVDLF